MGLNVTSDHYGSHRGIQQISVTTTKLALPACRSEHMNANLSIVLLACLALFASACASGPESLILGKWEVAGAQVGGVDNESAAAAGRAIKMSAEFRPDGTAQITMLGHTLQGTYKINGENELEWTTSGTTTKSKLNVTATELELADVANRTIKYKRK